MTRRLASVPVAKVRVPKDTLRDADPDWVETLAAMMAAEGQAQPIEVAAEGEGLEYVLVFGHHRLLAARKLGWGTIEALIDEKGGDAAARRRRAIHENLGRSLSKLDRAVHIGELHALLKGERGVDRGGDRRSDAARARLQKLQFGLAAEIAERVGLSERSIAVAVSIAHGISAGIRRRIVATPALARLADSQGDLERLALETDQRQTRILDIIAADDNAARTVADAIAELDGEKKPTETERHWSLAVNAYSRLQGRSRDRFFEKIEVDFLTWHRGKGRR